MSKDDKQIQKTKACTFEELATIDSIGRRFDCRSNLSDYEKAELTRDLWDAEQILTKAYVGFVNPTTAEYERGLIDEFHEFLTMISQLINEEEIPVDWPNTVNEEANPDTVGYYEYVHEERVRIHAHRTWL